MATRHDAAVPERLLARCKADPDNDKVRLTLADWLDENDQADWAELVRLQTARHGPNFADVDRIDSEREHFLRRRIRDTWGQGLLPHVRDVYFRRGLAGLLVTPEQAFALGQEPVGEAFPWLEEAEIEPQKGKMSPAQLSRFLACGWIENLGGISFDRSDLNRAAMIAIAKAPELGRLSSLKFSWLKMASDALPVLLSSLFLGKLRHLDFDNVPFGKTGAHALASSPLLDQLSCLRVHNCLNEPEFAALARTRRTTALRDLDLGFNEPGHKGIAALADSPLLEGCVRLNLQYGRLDDSDMITLAESQRLDSVRSLNLMQNKIGPHGIEALCRSPALRRLQSLDLWGNPLGVSGVSSLIAAPLMKNLRRLHLHRTRMRADGMRALIQSHRLAALELLNVGGNDFTASALEGVILERSGPGPRRLDIGSNRLYDKGAELLGRLAWLDTLEDLDVSNNKITATGLRHLAGTGRLGKLQRLSLWKNNVGSEGARILANCPQLTELTSLNLGYNRIDAGGIEALLDSPYLHKIRYMDLRGNRINAKTAALLRQRFGEAVEV